MRNLRENKEKIKNVVNFAKTQLSFNNEKNSQLFKKRTNVLPAFGNNGSLKHLTMSIKNFNNSKIPEDPSVDALLKTKEGKQIRQKYVRKIIEPNTIRYSKTMTKFLTQENEMKEIEKTKIDEEIILHTRITSNINTTRYITKVNDEVNKIFPFISTDKETKNLIGTFVRDKGNQSMNVQSLNAKLDFYSTSTFDKKVMLKNVEEENSFVRLKPETYYLEKMRREALELKGTDVTNYKLRRKC